MPFAHVGKYLDQLCDDGSVAEYFLRSRNQPNTSNTNSLFRVRS